MNDFTKDELAILKHVLNINPDGYRDPGLLNKIQSLIDNHCEHESNGVTYFEYPSDMTLTEALEQSQPSEKCKHCGEFYR